MARFFWALIAVGWFMGLSAPAAFANCPAGYGLKPTPGGFGGSSCQPLGTFNPGPRQQYNAPPQKSAPSTAAPNAALGAAIQILGTMAEEEARRAAAANDEAARQVAARRSYCDRNWRWATDLVSQGNLKFLVHGQALEAVEHFQRALPVIEQCGDRASVGRVRAYLQEAMQHSRAMRDDNRVENAMRRYGDTSRQRAPNPFEQPAAAARNEPAGNRTQMTPAAIQADAAKRCERWPARSEAWKQCMLSQEARIILGEYPDIYSRCASISDANKRNACALEAYAEKYARQLAATTPMGPAESLRDRIKRQLDADRRLEDQATPASAAEGADGGERAGGDRTAPAASPPTSLTAEDDDPLQHYLRSASATTGYTNAGKFDPAKPGFEGLEPTPEQRREMDDLLRREPLDAPGPEAGK